MIDEFAKIYLHEGLRWTREALVWKLDGLSEHDIRCPLTASGSESSPSPIDEEARAAYRAKIEQAARAADLARA